MQYIYFFGNGQADGAAENKSLLGGKGANLAEMTNLGIPVPPGFTINTDVCTHYMKSGNYPHQLKRQFEIALKKVEKVMGQNFCDIKFCRHKVFWLLAASRRPCAIL